MAEFSFQEDLPKRIVIVGGGATGWMAAALLGRCFSSLGVKITVIEPPGKHGIGVGEATIPSILRLLDNLGVEEKDFMLACDATYKLGIQFSDWLQLDRDYWHPFGICGARIDGKDLFHYWFTERSQKRVLRPYHSYSLHWGACLASKSPHLFGGLSPISHTKSYAFHMDAVRLADWLQAYATQRYGVEHLSDTVDGFSPNGRGGIAQLRLVSGRNIPAEMFLDCSGFQSQLIQQFMGVEFIDWSGELLCDRAVAIRTTASRSPAPYTRATAIESGWYWTIPLCSRTGLGYVYSSNHVDDELALAQLRSSAASGDCAQEGNEPLFLKLRVGRLKEFWKGNVIALGLASGFIEPLESTGIHLTQVAIETLLEFLPDRLSNDTIKKVYNHRMASLYDEVKDFVQLHYWLSKREEAFWRDAREAPLSSALVERLELYEDCGWIDGLRSDGFQETSYYHILSGSGRLPRRPSALSLATDPNRTQEVLQQILQQNESMLAQLPLHREMLDWVHTAGPDDGMPSGRLV